MAWLEAFCVLSLCIWFIYKWASKKNRFWADRKIPFEQPRLLFGNVLDAILMKKCLGEVICDIYRKHDGEKVVGVWLLGKPALLVRDPLLAHSIFASNFTYFANNDFEVDDKIDPILANNLFMQKDEQWRRKRQLITPSFTQGKIKATYEKFEEVVGKLIEFLKSHPEELNIQNTMARYTSEIVANWGMGINGHSFTENEPVLLRMGKMMFEPSGGGHLLFYGLNLMPWIVKLLKLSFVPKEVQDFFNGMLRDMIRERGKSSVRNNDYLQYYIDAMKKRQLQKNDDQDELTEDDIVIATVSFFVEGYETSSMLLTFIFWHLLKNPEIQKKLQTEVDELFESSDERPSLEAIVEHPYLQRIYTETLRMQTGLFYSAKKCTKTFLMDLGEGKELLIEPGESVLIPIIGLQTDPKYWENPLKFDPDRFLDESLLKRKGVYMPFGEGPRMCIGMRIAQAMIKTAVVHIIRNFEIHESANTPRTYVQEPKSFMPRQKGGFFARFVARS